MYKATRDHTGLCLSGKTGRVNPWAAGADPAGVTFIQGRAAHPKHGWESFWGSPCHTLPLLRDAVGASSLLPHEPHLQARGVSTSTSPARALCRTRGAELPLLLQQPYCLLTAKPPPAALGCSLQQRSSNIHRAGFGAAALFQNCTSAVGKVGSCHLHHAWFAAAGLQPTAAAERAAEGTGLCMDGTRPCQPHCSAQLELSQVMLQPLELQPRARSLFEHCRSMC